MTEIELTEEQQRRLQAEPGKPIAVVDPATNQRYVLLACDQYERVQPLLESTTPEQQISIAPMMLRSQQAFWRDLPALLPRRSRQCRYVAYHGDERIEFGRTHSELYQVCLRRGLPRGDFYVGLIEERDNPPWSSTPIERSLYECTDVPPPAAPPLSP
jgi:hypothetical protein